MRRNQVSASRVASCFSSGQDAVALTKSSAFAGPGRGIDAFEARTGPVAGAEPAGARGGYGVLGGQKHK